jgi:hypothetical protein
MLFIVMNNPVRLFNLGSPEVVQSLLESESPPPNPLPLETVMNTERQPPLSCHEHGTSLLSHKHGTRPLSCGKSSWRGCRPVLL